MAVVRARVIRPVMAACAALLVAALMSACSGSSWDTTKLGDLIAVGNRHAAGPLHGQLLDGTDYTLTSDAGKVVVLNFWATWCGPCVTEAPQLDAVYRARKAEPISFVGVDIRDAKDAVRSFVHDKQISYPILFDANVKTPVQLGHVSAQTTPFTVLIDRHGRIAAAYMGPVLPADLNPPLDELLAEQ